jgi:hypothetical protein
MTDPFMTAKSNSELQLGANPIGAGYQYRLFITFEFIKAAKKTGAFKHLRPKGCSGIFSNLSLGFIGDVNVNA